MTSFNVLNYCTGATQFTAKIDCEENAPDNPSHAVRRQAARLEAVGEIA